MMTTNNGKIPNRGISSMAVLGLALTASGVQIELQRLTQPIPGTPVSFDLVRVPGGTFVLGSDPAEPGFESDEGPRRTIHMSPFWIGVHEVTHDEFAIFRYRRLDSDSSLIPGHAIDIDAVTRPSPPYEDPAHGMGQGNNPATGMTQWAALQYAQWLSLKTGRLYRLPTEIEWEYACRAGDSTSGNPTSPEANLGSRAWYAANGEGTFHPVGSKLPNAWGIHDMLGNVAEWTLDEYDDTYYQRIPDRSPGTVWNRPSRTHPRTVRGGSFDDDSTDLRCANRLESTLRWKRRDPQLPRSTWWNTDSPHVGFRLMSPDDEMTLDEIRAYWVDVFGGR